MSHKRQPTRLRFAEFELDLRTYELWKNGKKVRLQGKPARLLALLATRAGELVTRADIEKVLWREEVVQFEHAINKAIEKVRKALADSRKEPRIIETLQRMGYRFIAPVEEVFEPDSPDAAEVELPTDPEPIVPRVTPERPEEHEPAAERVKPKGEFVLPLSIRSSRVLFLVIQVGYLAIYCATLHYVDALEWALITFGLTPVRVTLPIVIVIAMCGTAVRIYLLSSVGWAHPAAGEKFKRLFPILLVLDGVWAASPLLAARRIDVGVVLPGVAGLAYLPFAQRTLMWSIYRATPERSER